MVLPPDATKSDGWIGKESIGKPCDPKHGDEDCEGAAICLDIHNRANPPCDLSTGKGCGICTIMGCSLEELEKPGKEDNCPRVTLAGKSVQSICTEISLISSGAGLKTATVCLPSCKPSPATNPCREYGHQGVSCDPFTIVFNNQSEVCLNPTCSEDSDCGTDAICRSENGLCFSKGDDKGKIGGPCEENKDCGPFQYCLQQQSDGKGSEVFEGGYCTLVGCNYFKDNISTPFWQCPKGSVCKMLSSSLGLCLDYGCDFTKVASSDGCRDEVKDGQYDCIKVDDQNGVCWIDLQPKASK